VRSLFFCLYYQILSNVHKIYIYTTTLLHPASAQAVLAGENHSCVVSALGVPVHCAPRHRCSPRCRLFLCSLMTHDPFWSPSPTTTSIIQHKYIYINKLSETLAFYYLFGSTSQLIQFLSYPTLLSVFCDSCVCVSKHVLECVCCLCVK